MNCPVACVLRLDLVSGTQNSGKGFQELECWRDGGLRAWSSESLGILSYLQESEILESLREPGAPGETCLTASLPHRVSCPAPGV